LFSTVNLLENLILTKQKKTKKTFIERREASEREREREKAHIQHVVHVRIFHFQTIISGGYVDADLFERSAYVCE